MEENGEEEYFEAFNGLQDSLDPVEPAEEQDFYDPEESTVKRKRQIGVYWNKPPTKVYKDNFGYGVNGYQPMIDYLDAKDSGFRADKSEVHLPYLEERCLNKYSAQKPFKFYNNSDIDKYIAKGEKIITQIRQNDAAGASNVLRRTHTNWSMTKKYVQLVKNSFVIDYRKLHSEDKEGEDQELLHRYTVPRATSLTPYTALALIPRFVLSNIDAAMSFGTYIRNKVEHDNEMLARRERLQSLDDQYEATLQKLSLVVDKINQRVERMPQVISPVGRIYTPQDMLDVADDLVETNRMRRQEDLERLAYNVDALIDGSVPRVQPLRYYAQDSDVGKINPTVLAVAKRNADAAIQARSAFNRLYGPVDSNDTVDVLRKRYLNYDPVPELEDPLLPPSPRLKNKREDLISDVQTRILNRAREMSGVSGESLRISNRAKFVNTVSPRPDTESVDFRVPPSRIERNIVNMAKSLAYTGKPTRQYDVDEEVDEPVSNINTNITKTYCTKEYEKPVSQIPSDSNYARNAAIKARTRNALLGN